MLTIYYVSAKILLLKHIETKEKTFLILTAKKGTLTGQLQKSVDALGGGLTKYIAQAVYEERKIRHSSHL